jgi:HPt (histidine-containing phosphotransfer) domain-containing protein
MAETKSLIDLKFALTQLSGNADLLSRMLTKFVTEFGQVPSDVRQFIDQGNMQDAKLKVHTTKGLSGNLGLTALFESSKKLDQQIRDNVIEPAQLDDFERLMKETCELIENIDLDTTLQKTFDDDETDNQNDYKDEFIERLKRNEFIDDDMLHKYISSLSLDSNAKNELRELVEELQYAKAIAMIK